MTNEEQRIAISQIAEGIENFQKNMKMLGDSFNQNFIDPLNQIAQITQSKLESIDKAGKALANFLQTSSLPFVSLFEPLQSKTFPLFDRIEEMRGVILNLPLEKWSAQINWNLNFESISSIAGKINHFDIVTDIEIINGEESALFVENKQLKIEVISLRQTLTEKEKIIVVQQNQLNQMKVLSGYYLSGGSPLVQIREIKFLKETCELKIDQKIVKIEEGSNQYYLCKMLFGKNNPKFTKRFDAINFADVQGVQHSSGYAKIMRDTSRHLNMKIAQNTGISDLIIYKDQKTFLNIKYFNS